MQSDETLGDSFYDLLVHFIDAEVAFNEDDAVGLAARYFAILLPHAFEEFALFLLEAIFVLAGFGCVFFVAAASTDEACVERWKQEQGQVWLKVAANEAVQFEHAFRAEFATSALVGLGRIGKAIAKHDTASAQCGLDDLRNCLSTVCEHQSHFGHRREGSGAGVEE